MIKRGHQMREECFDPKKEGEVLSNFLLVNKKERETTGNFVDDDGKTGAASVNSSCKLRYGVHTEYYISRTIMLCNHDTHHLMKMQGKINPKARKARVRLLLLLHFMSCIISQLLSFFHFLLNLHSKFLSLETKNIWEVAEKEEPLTAHEIKNVIQIFLYLVMRYCRHTLKNQDEENLIGSGLLLFHLLSLLLNLLITHYNASSKSVESVAGKSPEVRDGWRRRRRGWSLVVAKHHLFQFWKEMITRLFFFVIIINIIFLFSRSCFYLLFSWPAVVWS